MSQLSDSHDVNFKRKGNGLSQLLRLLRISLLLTFASVLFASTDYVEATNFGFAPSGDSDYRETTVWGQPAPFIIDNPYNRGAKKIDSRDIFNKGNFFGSWFLSFIAVGTVCLTISPCINRFKKPGSERE